MATYEILIADDHPLSGCQALVFLRAPICEVYLPTHQVTQKLLLSLIIYS